MGDLRVISSNICEMLRAVRRLRYTHEHLTHRMSNTAQLLPEKMQSTHHGVCYMELKGTVIYLEFSPLPIMHAKLHSFINSLFIYYYIAIKWASLPGEVQKLLSATVLPKHLRF